MELVRVIAPAVAVTVASGSLMFSARAKAAGLIFKNPLELATFLGKLASVSALAEFLLNPIFGKLSDTYGRRAIMPLGHISLVVCRFLMFLNPMKMWPLILEQVATVPLVTSFFTTWRAALSDELEGGEFAQATAYVGVSAGVGLVTGPFIAKFLMNRFETKWCYFASMCMAGLGLLQIQTNFKETLPKESRVPMDISDMQPLSFLQVMGKSSTLFKLMCTVSKIKIANAVPQYVVCNYQLCHYILDCNYR